MREFGGDPAAIGQKITLRSPFTVIGVLPAGFRYMTPADVYLLLEPQVAANYRGMPSRGSHTSLYAVGRLKPAVSVMAARTEMQAIAAALALEYPLTNTGSDVHLVPLADRIVGDMAPTLRVLAGGVTLLLLIACVNLAVLLLNKSASRAHEFSIRAAIGASRWTLIRQLLIEQGLLVVTGGVLAALAASIRTRRNRSSCRSCNRRGRRYLPSCARGARSPLPRSKRRSAISIVQCLFLTTVPSNRS
jgi:ABC-type antimicrobial peptide transport system permease subunit